jgi:hypothetical protein
MCMENSDTVSDALLDAAASSTFENHDNGGEPVRFRGSTNSFYERSGCSWSIAPPPRRSKPNHVRRIDEKHSPSLTDPAFREQVPVVMGARRAGRATAKPCGFGQRCRELLTARRGQLSGGQSRFGYSVREVRRRGAGRGARVATRAAAPVPSARRAS